MEPILEGQPRSIHGAATIYLKHDMNIVYAGSTENCEPRRPRPENLDSPELYRQDTGRNLHNKPLFQVPSAYRDKIENLLIWTIYLGELLKLRHRFQDPGEVRPEGIDPVIDPRKGTLVLNQLVMMNKIDPKEDWPILEAIFFNIYGKYLDYFEA
jgi:hypothetical protein